MVSVHISTLAAAGGASAEPFGPADPGPPALPGPAGSWLSSSA